MQSPNLAQFTAPRQNVETLVVNRGRRGSALANKFMDGGKSSRL
jgi:hypothetical protein